MGYLQNNNKKKKPTESFGSKVKNVAETLGHLKGMYETGKAIYSGMQVAAPYIAEGLALLV